MLRKALRFPDNENLQTALALIDELAAKGPVDYDVVAGSTALVLPQWAFDQLLPLLQERNVKYDQAKITPINKLLPKEQAKLRGLIWRKG